MAEKKTITAIYSKLNENILKILLDKKYISNFAVEEDNNKKSLKIELRYNGKQPAVQDVKLFSKPGRRQYAQRKEVRPTLGGLGMSLVSTSKGLMTDSQAREQKVGGEVLFSIW